MQFGLGCILEWMVIVAIWAASPLAAQSLDMLIAFGFVAWFATWGVAGRTFWSASRVGFRRAMAIFSGLLFAGCFGLFCYVGSEEFMPIAWLVVGAVVVLLPVQIGVPWLVGSVLLFMLLLYFLWLLVFKGWDWMASFVESSEKQHQGPLATIYATLNFLLLLPLAIQVFATQCFTFQGHREGRDEIHHGPTHCIAHVLMLLLGIAVAGWFTRRSLQSSAVPSRLSQLICWGYLSLYAAMTQLALFPFKFYFP